MQSQKNDEYWMTRAMALAQRGEGLVEPNPMVGCVITRSCQTLGRSDDESPFADIEVVGEGWHKKFGAPHAEVEAIRAAHAAGKSTNDTTAYVTLEPCCHHGKTPPCTEAILQAGIKRVVVAMRDPFRKINGGGIAQLKTAGLEVETGCLEPEARQLNAPYLTRIEKRRPWIIAKWAMTLDGKMATRTGSSFWVSSDASRETVHRLRARVDAIMIGSRTAQLDDPQLTARHQQVTMFRNDGGECDSPNRIPLRIVFDSHLTISTTSRLVRTAREVPVIIAASQYMLSANETLQQQAKTLETMGCKVLQLQGAEYHDRMSELLETLADRGITNLLVEGGGQLLGFLFDHGLVDEVHVFIAPKIVGGTNAVVPVRGLGIESMLDAGVVQNMVVEKIGSDIYCHGRYIGSATYYDSAVKWPCIKL